MENTRRVGKAADFLQTDDDVAQHDARVEEIMDALVNDNFGTFLQAKEEVHQAFDDNEVLESDVPLPDGTDSFDIFAAEVDPEDVREGSRRNLPHKEVTRGEVRKKVESLSEQEWTDLKGKSIENEWKVIMGVMFVTKT